MFDGSSVRFLVNAVFVPVSDIARSVGFYQLALGLAVHADWGEYVDMRFPAAGPEAAGLALYRRADVPIHEHVTFNLSTDDVERVHDQLARAGFEVGELSTLGEFLHFELNDPDGHAISIVGPVG
jgi:predicted enzyme related to lactoylglutathione lyase